MSADQRPRPAGLRRLAAAPRDRPVRPRAGRHRRRAGRPAGADHHRRRQPGRPAVRGAAPAGRRRRGPGPGRRRAAGPGRAAAGTLAARLLPGLDPVPGQVVAEHSPAWRLPGVLAPLALLDAEDGYGGRYGLVLDRRTGMLTATLRVIPASTWLADRQDADTWVANWGGWLASLGYLPAVRHVTVTVDTAPEPGSTLADSVAAALDPAAPLAARQIMGQLVAAAPAAAADVDTRVSITFDPAASPSAPAGLTEAAAEVGRTLHGLESALGTCGVTVLGRATPAEIAGVVRTAFDPAARGEVNRLLAQAGDGRPVPGLSWAEAGPVGAEEEPGCYRHDSGISLSWSWREAPRQNVTADVLARLVAPGRYPKRVSLQYRPFSAADATRTLEAEVNAAQFRAVYKRRTGRDETARDSYDQARARQAAAEEAARRRRLPGLDVRHRHRHRPRRAAPRRRRDRGRRRVLPDPAAPDDLQPGRRIGRHPAGRHLPRRAGPPDAALATGARHHDHAEQRPAAPRRPAPRRDGNAAAARPRPRRRPPRPAAGAGAARLGMEGPPGGPGRARDGGTGIPGHHHPGLRPVPVRRRVGHPRRRHAGRPAPALGRGRLPGPAGLAARRAGHQPRRVRPRPARHRQDPRWSSGRSPGPWRPAPGCWSSATPSPTTPC